MTLRPPPTEGAHDAPPEVPRALRAFVHGFLALIALCGVARIEAWPLSGFRLFSTVRHEVREHYQVDAVDPDGHETVVVLADLPVAYRNTSSVLHHFDDLTAAERDEICAAWVTPLRERGEDVEFVRVYLALASVRPDAPPPVRTPMWECGRR